jgi:hypothetical protein
VSEREDQEGTPRDKGEAGPPQRTEPRLPWEVLAPSGAPASRAARTGPDPSAGRFAETGKLDVLAKIARLRGEIDHLYHDRNRLKGRVSELENACAEAGARIAAAQEETRALEQEKADMGEERRELLEQIADLRGRLEKSEAAVAEALDQWEAARSALGEITDVLSSHEAADDGQEAAPGPHPE